MKCILFSKAISLVLLLGAINVIAGGSPEVDFCTPEKTILTYYMNHNNRDVLSACFYPVGFDGSLEKFWSKYQIIEKRVTTKSGESTHTGIVISKDSMEIIVEVEMKDANKNNPKTKFWYLLQQIEGEWKIIDHSHIPNGSYPAYD